MDNEDNYRQYDPYRKKAKRLSQSLTAGSEPSAVIVDEPYYFLYIVEQDVLLLTFCEKAYPKKLALKFLEDLKDEFFVSHGGEIRERKLRPFAFQNFDLKIQKTKRLYQDTKSQRNLNKVSSDLKDINRILQQNISDILDRGAKIERVATMSDDLVASSKKYEAATKQLVFMAWLRKWGFIAFFVAFFVFVLLFWWWY